ncbi:hypothetical protein M405DRAFT_508870 [Rhizopogon salebrosus TDB-379]|nr:hypothetical protein M405DRAFT_508870 [Rhizopogon salebrosus TDB-379]
MPSRRISRIRSATRTISSRSQICHRAKLLVKQDGTVMHPLDARYSSPMPIQTRQLLLKARKLAISESQCTGRKVGIIDVILATTPPKKNMCQKILAMQLYWAKRTAIVKTLHASCVLRCDKAHWDFRRMVYHATAAESRWKVCLLISHDTRSRSVIRYVLFKSIYEVPPGALVISLCAWYIFGSP